jgi:hypothetical protein
MNKDYLDRITESSGCTLEEYKYVYPRLLKTYSDKHVDFYEIRFIEREIKNHSENLEMYESKIEEISEYDYRRDNFRTKEDFLSTYLFFEMIIASHKAIIEYLEIKKVELKTPQPPTPPEDEQGEVKESPFSVLEWATIFYYADSCKYFNQKNKAENQSFFIDKHSITTSKKSFKNKVIEANKSINSIQNYSIEKLNKILPFIKENYSNGVGKIENDKEYLKINGKNDTDY